MRAGAMRLRCAITHELALKSFRAFAISLALSCISLFHYLFHDIDTFQTLLPLLRLLRLTCRLLLLLPPLPPSLFS
jgi:hypothetical protein